MEHSRIWLEERMKWKKPTEKCDRMEANDVSDHYWPRSGIEFIPPS